MTQSQPTRERFQMLKIFFSQFQKNTSLISRYEIQLFACCDPYCTKVYLLPNARQNFKTKFEARQAVWPRNKSSLPLSNTLRTPLKT